MVGILPGWVGPVVSSLHDELVGLSSLHIHLRDQKVIDVPGDAPRWDACEKNQRNEMLTKVQANDFVSTILEYWLWVHSFADRGAALISVGKE